VGYAPASLDAPATTSTFFGRLPRRQVQLGLLAAVVVLALAETGVAVVAPSRAPTDADWREAARWVAADHQDQDLIVAAPAWADPVLRSVLGDLIPPKMAGRLDHERFSRVWEVSQRGADAPEASGARMKAERRFGRLRVRLLERQALEPTYDFVDNWAHARVFRVEDGRPPVACQALPGKHQCPGIGHNFVQRGIMEMGEQLHQALYAQPVAGATVAIEYTGVLIGRELAVGAGLHNVWERKKGDGTVWLRALIDGQEVGRFESGSDTGWRVMRFDTRARAGRSALVRFEITSQKPFARHFGFAAEARGT
jgi:hypothetical protein